MATFQPARITKLMREKNFPCYVISDGKNEIDAQLNEKLSVGESIERLMESLSEISGNDVTVEIAPAVAANGKLTGRGKMHFERVDLSQTQTASKQIAGFTPHNADISKLIEKNIELEKKLIEMAAQKKIDELNARMEALEKGDNNPINGLIGTFMEKPEETINALSALWQMVSKPQVQTTAVQHLNGLDEINNCIVRLMAVDPHFEEHLHKLAAMAENDPNKYFMALKFL